MVTKFSRPSFITWDLLKMPHHIFWTIYQTTNYWIWPNWKQLADVKLNIDKMTISVCGRHENTVGKVGYELNNKSEI